MWDYTCATIKSTKISKIIVLFRNNSISALIASALSDDAYYSASALEACSCLSDNDQPSHSSNRLQAYYDFSCKL